jgi:hypothetical protein
VVQAESMDPNNTTIDQEIEDQLMKLKFFNNVWLSSEKPLDIPGARPLNFKDIEFLDTDDPETFVKVGQNEPIESPNEEREEFNTWYENARNHSKMKSLPKPFITPTPIDSALSSSSSTQCMVERPRSSTDRQVMFNTPSVWQVNMDIVIVIIIKMFKLLMPDLLSISKYFLFSDPLPSHTPVPNPSYLSHSPSSMDISSSLKQQATVTPASLSAPVKPADVTTLRSLQRTASWDLVKRWGSEALLSEISGFLN